MKKYCNLIHEGVQIDTNAEYIREKISQRIPKTAMILGSGLGIIAEQVQNPVVIPYDVLNGFPLSKVKGHAGQLVIGQLGGQNVLLMQGRSHYYEGHSMQKLTLPVRVFKQLGVKNLIVTSASGGLNESFNTGDLMLLTDIINFVFDHPNIGNLEIQNNDSLVPNLFDTSLQQIARNSAMQLKMTLREGAYFFFTGPCYETPAEVQMARKLGGDVAGMSTLPESIVANSLGIKVLGLTYISNMAAGISNNPLDHQEVMDTMEMIKDKVIKFLVYILQSMNR